MDFSSETDKASVTEEVFAIASSSSFEKNGSDLVLFSVSKRSATAALKILQALACAYCT